MYFKEESERFSKLLEKLAGKRVAVIGHVRPDGDCIGAQVALCRILRSRGIDAVCVNHHPVPYNLKNFVGDTPFFHEPDFENDGRIAVAVDCGNLSRLGKSLLEKAFPQGVFAAIDHHETNEFFASEENIVVTRAAATCHLLAAFCLDCGISIDPVLANALYVGIATDTGQFQYSSTTAEVLEIAGRKLAEKHAIIKNVRGEGLMIGAVLHEPAGGILALLREKNMLALSAGETVLRLLPPLTVTEEECATALALIDEAMTEYENSKK